MANSMENDVKSIRRILVVFLVAGIHYLLYALSSLVTPLILSSFIALLLYPALQFLVDKKIPKYLALFAVVTVVFLLLGGITAMIRSSVMEIYADKEQISEMFLEKVNSLGFSVGDLDGFFSEFINPEKISEMLTPVLSGAASFLGGSFTFFFYLLLISSGLLSYKKYLKRFGNGEDSTKWFDVFIKIKESFSVYIRVKVLISLGTGFCFWIICSSFGISSAMFWGFLAFCLNFIPTFGSVIATIIPVCFGFLYLEPTPLIIYGALLGVVQFIFGNILEPIFLDKQLSINTLTILFGLVFWNEILGVTGLFLAVPLLVLTKILLENIEGGKKIALFMES
ncbi:AI-2E family transporter [Sediminitomix flava]|uniref:Putative PurR-regulated permease PerM n=1 Tax=Sediminitomix flava TaxID=379075 RepID=A0A315Z896_SEDFL|nr:AI-2E family transporter [Sediminitomix flava]PWJ39256.1 putative PurR-regulated permease PerM [Sediminitomix flava]